MESKKQLIIVPPMSEAFKKLHEVLIEIADSENIEITKITETVVLNQMTASAQNLIIFSNVKNCAVFLLENKSHILKFHTRVVLLTPKEIPSKTLVKLSKSGLAEAILETSPPKTLLHKIKMHLRTIKAPKFDLGEKDDQVVSSMNNSNRISSNAVSDTFSKAKGKPSSEEELVKNNLKEIRKDGEKEEKPEIDLAIEAGALKEKAPAKKPKVRGELNVGRERDIYYPARKKIDVSLRAISEHLRKKRKEFERSPRAVPGKKNKELTRREIKKPRDKAMNERGQMRKNDSNITPGDTLDYSQEDVSRSESVDSSYDIQSEDECILTEEEASDPVESRDRLRLIEEIALGIQLDVPEDFFEYKDEDFRKSYEENEITCEITDHESEEVVEEITEEESGPSPEYEIGKAAQGGRVRSEEEIVENGLSGTSHDHGADELEEVKKERKNLQEMHEDAFYAENDHALEELSHPDEERKSGHGFDEVPENNASEKSEMSGSSEEEKRKAHSENIIEKMASEKKSNLTEGLTEQNEEFSENETVEETESSENSKNGHDDVDNELNGSSNDNDENHSDKDKASQVKSIRSKSNSSDPALKNKSTKDSAYSWDNLVDKAESDDTDFYKTYQEPVAMDLSYLNKEIQEQTIVYHKATRPVRKFVPEIERFERAIPQEEIIAEKLLSEEENQKRVIEVDARGIEFSIEIVKLIYKKNTTDTDYFDAISRELVTQYKAYPVFFSFDSAAQKHSEAFNSIGKYNFSRISENLNDTWQMVSATGLHEYFGRSIPVWQCREIKGIDEETFWENTELPSWASIELANKKVELVFPYFEGVERMGLVIVFFPEGINASKEKSIIITLETARTVFLNSIKRSTGKMVKRPQQSSIFDKMKSFFTKVYNFVTGKEDDEEN